MNSSDYLSPSGTPDDEKYQKLAAFVDAHPYTPINLSAPQTTEDRIIPHPTGGSEKQNEWAANIVADFSRSYQHQLRCLTDEQWEKLKTKSSKWWIDHRTLKGANLLNQFVNYHTIRANEILHKMERFDRLMEKE